MSFRGFMGGIRSALSQAEKAGKTAERAQRSTRLSDVPGGEGSALEAEWDAGWERGWESGEQSGMRMGVHVVVNGLVIHGHKEAADDLASHWSESVNDPDVGKDYKLAVEVYREVVERAGVKRERETTKIEEAREDGVALSARLMIYDLAMLGQWGVLDALRERWKSSLASVEDGTAYVGDPVDALSMAMHKQASENARVFLKNALAEWEGAKESAKRAGALELAEMRSATEDATNAAEGKYVTDAEWDSALSAAWEQGLATGKAQAGGQSAQNEAAALQARYNMGKDLGYESGVTEGVHWAVYGLGVLGHWVALNALREDWVEELALKEVNGPLYIRPDDEEMRRMAEELHAKRIAFLRVALVEWDLAARSAKEDAVSWE